MEIDQSKVGELIIEGKTKLVYRLKGSDNLVYVLSKDRITAGDGVKSHELEGKARLSTQTNSAIFTFLNAVGIKTAFVAVDSKNPNAFVAKDCAMIPIEWVSRRVATGSYLRRNPNIKEGYRFAPVKLETFFKDDENHDPYWSIDSLIEAKLNCGGLEIGRHHINEMLKVTELVFEVLERAWQSVDHALIDMKIEFGVVTDSNGKQEVVVSDVIDNDSWRLWPSGDKRLMLDKQIYRNLDSNRIDSAALQQVRDKFEIVAERTQRLFSSLLPSPEVAPTSLVNNAKRPTVAILLGSPVDLDYAEKIRKQLITNYLINSVSIHICSAHKSTDYALQVVSQLSQWRETKVIIACAGLSNGLGPVCSANTTIPVINSPPTSDVQALQVDLWSSMRLPSGLGATTTLGASQAALAAAHIVANEKVCVWSRIKTQQAYNYAKIVHSDNQVNN